jgi:hypothetical protein
VQLEAAGIAVKSGANLEGITTQALQNTITLNTACNCNVTVTEVTGGNHAAGTYSHANGYKVDLRTYNNPELVQYVQSLPAQGSWSDGTPLYGDSCHVYAIESDHIDAQYIPCE